MFSDSEKKYSCSEITVFQSKRLFCFLIWHHSLRWNPFGFVESSIFATNSYFGGFKGVSAYEPELRVSSESGFVLTFVIRFYFPVTISMYIFFSFVLLFCGCFPWFSRPKGVKRSKEFVDLIYFGGSNIIKFESNVPNLADETESFLQINEPKIITSCREDAMPVLGLIWGHKKDTIVVSRRTSCALDSSLTQRLVLILVRKVFDPTGLQSVLDSS